MSDLKTEILGADAQGYARAAAIWAHGGRVAMPTETVYGLAADARNDHAVAGIFAAKNRPSFNPLIVHVADITKAQDFVIWSDVAARLAEAFWPGPLTMVLPLRAGHGLSHLVSAGLATVAIRVPAHPVAQAALRAFGGAVAAPSANPSGKISPTSARHVARGLNGRIEAILDGGPCGVGLESTIIGLADGPAVLREGGIAREEIEAALGQRIATQTDAGQARDITAPGQMSSHYAPNALMRLNATDRRAGEVLLGFGDMVADMSLSPTGDLREAAANLFAMLHELDQNGATHIAVAPIPDHGLGRAINDRLRRAAAPRP